MVVLIIASLFSVPVAAQQRSAWLASFNTFKLSKKLSLHTDVQFRSTDKVTHLQSILVRPGLNYHLNKKTILTVGYAFIRNRRTSGNQTGYAIEHRTWQQLLYTQKIKYFAINHRLRIEQRYFTRPVLEGVRQATGQGYANRFRYFVRSVIPLVKQPAFTRGTFVALQNEVFLNFGNTADVNGKTFDQNRAYIAAGYRLHPSVDVELGYMNQYVLGRSSTSTSNNILQLAVYLRL